MKSSTKLKRIVISWDFIIAVFICVLLLFVLPGQISLPIIKNIFEMGISVLAIVFSVFFAALAVLITAGDNEFVRFLQEDNSYSQIVWSFKFTILSLFFALITSIVLFVGVLPFVDAALSYTFPKLGVILYAFVAIYSLCAAANCTLDAIRYAEVRARFLQITKDDDLK